MIEAPERGSALTTTQSRAPVRRRRGIFRGRLWVLPYLAPALGLIGFVYAFPLLKLLEYSFQSAPTQPGSTFTTANYSLAVQDPNFGLAIKHNLTLLAAVPILTVLAVVGAILVFRARGAGGYRAVLFLPYVLSIPIIGVTFSAILSLNGPLNAILHGVGLGALRHDWLGNPSFALWSVMAVIIWKEFGFGLLLFSARMSSIDEELYDAARVDGARAWARHWYVTVPGLGQTLSFFVVVGVVTMLAFVFGYVYTMTYGGPGNATIVMEFQIWEQGFASGNLGLASATAVILLGGMMLLLALLSIVRLLVRKARA